MNEGDEGDCNEGADCGRCGTFLAENDSKADAVEPFCGENETSGLLEDGLFATVLSKPGMVDEEGVERAVSGVTDVIFA